MRFVLPGELSDDDQRLLREAQEASQTATCTYSGFPVGAAVWIETPDGQTKIVRGNNYETINYYSVCAEKHAVMRAFSDFSVRGEDGVVIRPKVRKIAVWCGVAGAPVQPCGDCRQMLSEVGRDIEVISAAGPGRADGLHDTRVTRTTVRALLPSVFDAEGLKGAHGQAPSIVDDPDLSAYVVHLPKPAELRHEVEHRVGLLRGVQHLILVGPAKRARQIAELAHRRFGALQGVDEACYCDPNVSGRGEGSREYAVYAFTLPSGAKVAAASHGIGKGGAEILLSELPALVALAQGGEPPEIKGVLRCGTRGTLTRVPLGCVAVSTACFDEQLEALLPSSAWVGHVREAARELGMEVVPDAEIDARGEDRWPDPSKLLVEGAGLSADFFWQGQARPLYRPKPLPPAWVELDQQDRARKLAAWVRAGVRWVEMEDHTILSVSRLCGYPAVTLGAVIAHRRRADGAFQLSYSKEALARSESLPAELALTAIQLSTR